MEDVLKIDREDANKQMEKVRVREYLGEMEKYISEDLYRKLIRNFMEKDMEEIANMLKRLAKYAIQLEIQIRSLKNELEKAKDDNKKLKEEVKSLHEVVHNADRLRMKELYLSGMSLRAIARVFGYTHNAVKRKLEKMGVEIRK